MSGLTPPIAGLRAPRFEQVGQSVSLNDLSAALRVWRETNGLRPCSVRTAAIAFNTTPELVRSAVRECGRLILAGSDENAGTQFLEIA